MEERLLERLTATITRTMAAERKSSVLDVSSAVDAISAASASAVPPPSRASPSVFARVAAAVDGGSLAPAKRVQRPATPRAAAGGDESENDDDLTDAPFADTGGRVVVSAAAAGDLDRLQAPVAFAKVRRDYGSWLAWHERRRDFTSARSKHELRCMCTALDHLLVDVPATHPGIEVLVRRVNALNAVEKGNGWSVAKAIEGDADDDLLPRAVLRSALKEAALVEKLDPSSRLSKGKGKGSTSSSAGAGVGAYHHGRGGGRGRGGGGRGRGRDDEKRSGSSTAAGRGDAAPAT